MHLAGGVVTLYMSVGIQCSTNRPPITNKCLVFSSGWSSFESDWLPWNVVPLLSRIRLDK